SNLGSIARGGIAVLIGFSIFQQIYVYLLLTY
ncbi:MAG: hypothetical protein FD188_3528, partial [Ignavibacteria bacterium]